MAGHDVQATINYGKELDGRIIYDVATNTTNLVFDNVATLVKDARPMLDKIGLESHGFCCLNHKSGMKDWDSEAEIKDVCYKEAVELVKRATGGRSAFVFDHTLRRSKTRDGIFARDPVSFVHLDYTDDSGPKRLRDFIGAAADKVGRWAIVNVWRPINVPYVEDVPLGLLSAPSCPRADLLAYDIVYPDRIGGNYVIKSNPAHQWYYIHHQTPDEAYVFKQFDSDKGKIQYCPHSAFNNPDPEPGCKARESIELRLFVFFEDELPSANL